MAKTPKQNAPDTSNNTPLRSIRIPDDEWDQLKAVAKEDGFSVTTWLRMLYKKELARRKKKR